MMSTNLTRENESLYGKQFSRFRQDDQRLTATGIDHSIHIHGGIPQSDVTVDLPSRPNLVGQYREMTDVVTPGFKSRVKQGEVINTPMLTKVIINRPRNSVYGYVSSAAGTSCSAQRTGYAGIDLELAGAPGLFNLPGASSFPIESPLRYEKLLTRASISAHAAVTPPDIQALVATAELSKTLHHLAETARTIAAFGLGLKRRASDEALKALFGRSVRKAPVRAGLAGVERRWLEYRYAWGPLLLDLDGALQAVARGEETLSLRRTARGFANDEWTGFSGPQGPYYPMSTFNGGHMVSCQIYDKYAVRAYVLYAADLKYQRLRHFGLDSFASTAWELIPFSFVADWFAPIGDWIEALEPKFGVNYLATGYTVQRTTTRSRVVGAFVPSSDSHTWVESPGLSGHTDSATEITFWRERPLPIPSFPPINVKINVKRALDSIALIGALSGTRPQRPLGQLRR